MGNLRRSFELLDFNDVQTSKLLEIKETTPFVDELIETENMCYLDWTGEDDEYQLHDFVKSILNKHGVELTVDADQVYEKMDNQDLERGDHIIFMFEEYQKFLISKGFEFILLDTNSDSYIVFVVDQNKVDELLKCKLNLIDDFNGGTCKFAYKKLEDVIS